MSQILLSLCLSGRNDDYGFNFKRRFVQAMNFLAWSSRKVDEFHRLEVVFCDWNSAEPLANVIQLSEEATRMVRFIEVPPALASRYNPPDSPFSQSVAFNVSIRRARGAFIGIMPADILLTAPAVHNLLRLLDGKLEDVNPRASILGVPRKNIPSTLDEPDYFNSNPSIESLLFSADAFMRADTCFRGLLGGYGLFILPREIFHDVRGVDERIAGWGYNDIDLALRAADKARLVNTSAYGACCYDFEPSPAMIRQKKKREASFHPIRPGYAENTEKWGLADINLRESPASATTMHLPPFHSQRPPTVAFRDWIIYISKLLPSSIPPRISSLALAACWFSRQYRVGSIAAYGGEDLSVYASLALFNSFPSLFILKNYEKETDIHSSGKLDSTLSALHYQGMVCHIPTTEKKFDTKPDLLIFDSQTPSVEILKHNCTADSILIFSPAAGRSPEYLTALGKTLRLDVLVRHGVSVLASAEKVKCARSADWRPLKGNCISWFFSCAPVARFIGKIRKIYSFYAHLSCTEWLRGQRIFSTIRKG